ncbi:MAG: ATPase [Muribaculaceae bacterium]|nr:ATPase [Muribaculaceae bacterium]
MILIADCGSTKTDWCLLNNGEIRKRIFTGGMNAVMLTQEEISERIASELMPQLGDEPVGSVFFYGAGCLAEEVCANVRRAIAQNIASAKTIEVDTDLLAAARALCGRNAGIACIMGTGSNSCYYDGEKIVDNVSPLGFILGDEGSGAVLGRTLVGDVLKNQLPADLCQKFLAKYELDRLTIIRRVYIEPQANRFLASVTPFLLENIDHPAIHELVFNSFKAFFKRNVLQYERAHELTVNFVGSIAWYYRDALDEAARDMGCTVGNIIKSPMDGLIAYHSEY